MTKLITTVSINTPTKPATTKVKLNTFGATRPLDKVQAEPTPRKS